MGLTGILVALLLIAMLFGLGAGRFAVPAWDVALVLARAGLAALGSGDGAGSAPAAIIVIEVRLPRVLAAALVGAALAASGSAYQGLSRNPLVSPDILGVSAGASLGATLGIFLGLPVAGVQALAFVLGLGAVALVLAVGRMAGGRTAADPTLGLVLAGVAIGAMFGAAVGLLKVLADPYNQLPAITFWLLGSLAGITRSDLLAASPAMLLGLVPVLLLRHRIDVLTLGEDEARALGLDTVRIRLVLILAATLMTAAAVSISGVIGWIGLVIPHAARFVAGAGFARSLPAAALLGAAYLVGTDAVARVASSAEVPLGILTASIGAPFFLWLLARGQRRAGD